MFNGKFECYHTVFDIMYVESIEIKSITKSPGNNEILMIGGVHPNGVPWRLSAGKAINAIEEGKWKFHINDNGIDKKVIVKKRLWNKKSLAVSNGDTALFFKLPQCPSIL